MFTVTLARNGKEALQALQSPQGEHINLILTDVLMPEVHPFPAWLSQSSMLHNCVCKVLSALRVQVYLQPCSAVLFSTCSFVSSVWKGPSAMHLHMLRHTSRVSYNSAVLMQVDGIELMSELLQNEKWSHIPIIGWSFSHFIPAVALS